ncbi:hypothetical protein JZ751_014164 [Albula glossodonta]|uniref:PDZ domain-containing protein n=1 Tax=Albula glossodonta TaxID=121402 RepID=A0A8T2NS50_9TELE|nr:hypothetical protein JZ751_014164 [Albula glossodonta]
MEEVTVANGRSSSFQQKVGASPLTETEDALPPRRWPRPKTVLSHLHVPPRAAVSLPWPLASDVGEPTTDEMGEPVTQETAHLISDPLLGETAMVGGQGEPHQSKPWTPPRGFWKAVRPETLALKGHALPMMGDGPVGVGGAESRSTGTAVDSKEASAGGGMEVGGGALSNVGIGAGRQQLHWGPQRSDSLESLLRRCAVRDPGPTGPGVGLLRADSWESSSSSAGTPALTQRGEAHQGTVKAHLQKPQHCKHSDYRQGEHRYSVGPPGREGPVGVCGYLSDSSGSDSACTSHRRRYGHSPTRVRFQDESEMDAERRYLERQRPLRASERALGVPVSKPRLSPYLNGEVGGTSITRARDPDGSSSTHRKRRTVQGDGFGKDKKCGSCGTFLQGPPLPVGPHGHVEAGSWGKVLPRWVTPTCPQTCSLTEEQLSGGGDGTGAGEMEDPIPSLGKCRRRRGERRGEGGARRERSAPQLYPIHHHSAPSLRTPSPDSERAKTPPLSPTTSGPDPRRFLLEGPDPREARPKLSLRRFFSAIGLTSTGWLRPGRSSSVERLNSTYQQSPVPSPSSGHHGRLKKTPSLQSLGQRPPLIVLRRSSSVQDLPLQVKEELEALYRQAASPQSPTHRGLQQALSVENVGRPSGVRPVGRVAQVYHDGTVLLELNRPPSGPFGFVIYRPNGRTDSGVYVELMQDGGKLYAGLLSVGDEILEVNGKKVCGLSLDQVTRLMTQDSIAYIRVLPHRRAQR